jgi:multisubunit Na+/H+ antiporter MnhE subunit
VDEQIAERGPHHTRRRRGMLTRSTVEAVAVASVWLVFAGTLATGEVVAAVLVGLITAASAAALRRRLDHDGRGGRVWVRQLPRICLGMVVDCAVVTVELTRTLLGRPGRSRLHAVPFEVGDDAPSDVARRVVTTVGLTLQPNSIVLGFDRARQVVLVHALTPRRSRPLVPPDLARRP